MSKSAIVSYVMFGVAIAVVAANVLFGIIDQAVMLIVIGLLGFSGVAALRTFIDSTGYKTYVMLGLGVLAFALSQFGIITPEALKAWLSVWGLLTGGTVTHAIQKAQTK